MCFEYNGEKHIGKTIIIGLTFLNSSGHVEQEIQLFGAISKISDDGILVNLDDGEDYTLPPDLSAVKIAPPGEYKFKTTGKVIVNPDYMTTWTIHMSENSD